MTRCHSGICLRMNDRVSKACSIPFLGGGRGGPTVRIGAEALKAAGKKCVRKGSAEHAQVHSLSHAGNDSEKIPSPPLCHWWMACPVQASHPWASFVSVCTLNCLAVGARCHPSFVVFLRWVNIHLLCAATGRKRLNLKNCCSLTDTRWTTLTPSQVWGTPARSLAPLWGLVRVQTWKHLVCLCSWMGTQLLMCLHWFCPCKTCKPHGPEIDLGEMGWTMK